MYASITLSRIDNRPCDSISIITNLCDTPESTLTDTIDALPTGVERRDIDQLPALSLTAVTVMSPDPKQEFRIESLGDAGGDTGTR